MTELLTAMGHDSFQHLAGWARGAGEAAVAEGREGLMLAVADADGSVHIWPLDWCHMADDRHAFGYCRGELARRVEEVGGVGHALFVPAWIGEDGTVWALSPDEPTPGPEYAQALLLSVACADERSLLVGAVNAGPPRRIDRWDPTRTGVPEAEALALRVG